MDYWGDGKYLNYPPPDVNLDVSTVAQSPTVTVFVKVDHNQSIPNSVLYIDMVSLIRTGRPIATAPNRRATHARADSHPADARSTANRCAAHCHADAHINAHLHGHADSHANADCDAHADDHAHADGH